MIKKILIFLILVSSACYAQNWSSKRLLAEPEKYFNKKAELFVIFAEVPAINALDDEANYRDFNCYTGDKDMGRVRTQGYIIVRVSKDKSAGFLRSVGTERQYTKARLIRGTLRKDDEKFYFEYIE